MNRVDLIDLVAADLTGYRLDRRGPGTAVFVSEQGDLDLEVSEKVERRFLGRTRVATFTARFPAPDWGDRRIRVRHSGGMRRTGIDLRSDGAGPDLVERLQGDEGFAAATTALDFKRYEVLVESGTCRATVELMGAALVAIALPPIRSYVRLHPDQRDALIDGFEALRRVLSVSPADRRY